MTGDIQSGSAWKHCIEIAAIGPGKLDAGIDLKKARWTRPTALVSLAISLLLGFASFSAFARGDAGGGIAAALFACVTLAVAVFALGCLTYTVRLRVDGAKVTFARRFFWRTKEVKTDKVSLGCLRCWDHSIGSGSSRSHHFHVCLHPSSQLPVLSLFSKEYFPDLTHDAGSIMGMSSDKLSEEEAKQLALGKADEIAACLGIEHETGSNKSIQSTFEGGPD